MERGDAVTEGQRPDGIESLATEADNLAPPLGEGVTDADVAAREPAPVATNAELVAGMVKLARDTVTQLADVQSIQQTINDATAQRLGDMWGQVLDGYGIKLSDHLGKHGQAIMAALATMAIGVNVVKGYRAEQAAKPKATPSPAPAPEQPAAA